MAAEASSALDEEKASAGTNTGATAAFDEDSNENNAIHDIVNSPPPQAQDPPINIRSNVDSDEAGDEDSSGVLSHDGSNNFSTNTPVVQQMEVETGSPFSTPLQAHRFSSYIPTCPMPPRNTSLQTNTPVVQQGETETGSQLFSTPLQVHRFDPTFIPTFPRNTLQNERMSSDEETTISESIFEEYPMDSRNETPMQEGMEGESIEELEDIVLGSNLLDCDE